MCGSTLAGMVNNQECIILHHVSSNIGGFRKICQICKIKRLSIALEDKKLLNKREDLSNNCVYNRRLFIK